MASLFKSKAKEYLFTNEEILNQLADMTVLVTGGAGAVGSSLCRQIIKHSPKQLIVLDVNENTASDLKQEIPDIKVLVGSTSDIDKINDLFKEYKPDFVFYASTYKNAMLMEDSPCEVIKNNVLGTYNVARASRQYGAKGFFFISNNEAEDPQNIMAKSFAIAEIIVEGSNKYSDTTKYLIYRFDDKQNIVEYKLEKNLKYDELTFNIQTAVVAARSNDSNKTIDYVRQALK